MKNKALEILSFFVLCCAVACGNKVEVPSVDLSSLQSAQEGTIKNARARVISNPRSGEAWGEYGMALRAFGFHTEAQQSFERAQALDSADPRWPYFLARSPHANDPKEAVRWLTQAVELCGNDPVMPRWHLGRTWVEENRWAEAEAEIKALLSSHADWAPAALLQARLEMARTNLVAADEWLEKCWTDIQTRKAAAALKAQVLQQQGEIESALVAARRAAALPADEPIYDVFEAAIQSIRNDPSELSKQVHRLLSSRDLTNAALMISILQTNHTDSAETWLLLGRLRVLRKEHQGAVEAFYRHLERKPDSVQGLFQLGLAQMSLEEFEKSAESFAEAVRLKPDFGPAWFNRGIALARAGKLREGIEAFQEAIRCNPEHLETYLLLADIYIQQNKPGSASKLLGEASLIHPGHPRIRMLEEKVRALERR